MTFPSSERICRIEDPLDWTPAKVDLMVRACREIAQFHIDNSQEMRAFYARRGFSPDQLRGEDDIARIPAVMVSAMKRHLLLTRPAEHAVLKLTSSGTRGQKTQVWFDAPSLDRIQATLDGLWRQEGLTSEEPTNYLMFVYDPDASDDLGISFSFKNEQRFAPPKQTACAIRKLEDGSWFFDKERLYERAREFVREGLPVRVSGIPSFMFEFMSEMRARGPLRLPRGSLVMTCGGWKAAEDKQITREQFRAMLTEMFGVEAAQIRDSYGMAEHCAPYIECRHHRFHVPVYARVIIRDPVTLAVLPPGEIGLMELVCPYNTMMPNLAILSTDLARIDPDPCACGRNAPTFTLTGRAGLTKYKGCALTAAEIVRR